MSLGRKVIIYGANGYTGKLVAESLANRQIPFYFAGRSKDKLEKALGIVRERLGANAWKLDAEIVAVDNSVEKLLPVFSKCSIVINVAGPFMQVAWPVVEAALKAGCHYTDTTGEQDWVIAIADKFGAGFAAKGLLMAHRQLSEEDAHKTMRQMAMNQNRRLIEVAEAVLAMAAVL